MKKNVSMLLVASLMLVSLLAGCSGQTAYSAAFSLQETHCVRIARDLTVPGDVVRYSVMPSANNIGDPLLAVTRKCMFYRPNRGFPIPASVSLIPWVILQENLNESHTRSSSCY
ncbi:hypothetical protein [Paenibacillus sp. OSY-SE]|uniref:hypothetical protein n=1 Tax=Paenibacillus sp. OSY-SE TaxID=1196323 RepID=UPI0012FCC491|nr:hypothetical protein [Paenibacillus sp. OSY-SE]